MSSGRANRAVQFAPFDALKGLQEALREKEEQRSRVERRALSDEMEEQLSEVLTIAEKGMYVEVVSYCNGHYITLKGKLTEKNITYRYISINDRKIFFLDLYEMKILYD